MRRDEPARLLLRHDTICDPAVSAGPASRGLVGGAVCPSQIGSGDARMAARPRRTAGPYRRAVAARAGAGRACLAATAAGAADFVGIAERLCCCVPPGRPDAGGSTARGTPTCVLRLRQPGRRDAGRGTPGLPGRPEAGEHLRRTRGQRGDGSQRIARGLGPDVRSDSRKTPSDGAKGRALASCRAGRDGPTAGRAAGVCGRATSDAHRRDMGGTGFGRRELRRRTCPSGAHWLQYPSYATRKTRR